jgi:subtilisin family serine protease
MDRYQRSIFTFVTLLVGVIFGVLPHAVAFAQTTELFRCRSLITLATAQDTTLRQDAPSQNFHADNTLTTSPQVDHTQRALLKFDLTSVPTDSQLTVLNAILQINLVGPQSDQTVRVHALASSWTVAAATWSTSDGATGWISPGGDYNPTAAGMLAPTDVDTAYQADVTQLVQNWMNGSLVNHGVILAADETSSQPVDWHSTEAAEESLHPRLVVLVEYLAAEECELEGMASGQTAEGVTVGFQGAFSRDRLNVGLLSCTDTTWLNERIAAFGGVIVESDTETCFYLLKAPVDQQLLLQTDLQHDPRVVYAELDARVSGNFTPNDPFYNNPSYTYAPQQINAPIAWDYTTGDANLIVAVLDTGVDPDHVEFAGRLLPGYDYVNDDSTPSDDNGHGTHVAGIVGAAIDNSIGLAGIAGNVKILPLKVLDKNKNGWWSDTALAVTSAVDQGAKVINLSMIGTSDSTSLRNSIQYAYDHNVLVVVAAGNNNSNTPAYPASYNTVLAVGATDSNGNRWTLSNYGPNVDVMAPGSSVYSTYWKTGLANSYAFASGTSMATPHAAGAAALLFSRDPSLTTSEVISYLTSTVVDMGEPGVDTLHGFGRIDVGAALTALWEDNQSSSTSVAPGDCNADQVVNAGDLSALVLELFDGDGSLAADARQGTFVGEPGGCDSNSDSLINAGDLSCEVIILFNSGPVCSGQAGGTASPQLVIPSQVVITQGDTVTIPIVLDDGGGDIGSVVFSVDYDESLLSFDPTDTNNDGVPDAVSFATPSGSIASVAFDPTDWDGELDFILLGPSSPPAELGSSTLVSVTFVATTTASGEGMVGFSMSPPPSFGTVSGRGANGLFSNGSVNVTPAQGIVAGVVWWDIDGDGERDAGEPGIPGVDVALAGRTSQIKTSASDGGYSFTHLPAGTRAARVVAAELQSGGTLNHWFATKPATAGYTLTLASGQALDQIVFGFDIDSSYSVSSRIEVSGTAQMGNLAKLTVQITNTGNSWLTSLPLRIVYPAAQLKHLGIRPPADFTKEGQVAWSDLTTTLGSDLAPGASIEIVLDLTLLSSTAALPTGQATVTSTLNGVFADPDGPSGSLSAQDALALQSATVAVTIGDKPSLPLGAQSSLYLPIISR